MFHNLQSLLSGSIKRVGIGQQVEESLVMDAYSAIVKEILSPEEAERIKPMYVRNKGLAVASLSSEATAKIQAKEREIIEKINKKLGSDALNQIKYIA
jgi:predicted nucleic acid-binding Zn ribbon protein